MKKKEIYIPKKELFETITNKNILFVDYDGYSNFEFDLYGNYGYINIYEFAFRIKKFACKSGFYINSSTNCNEEIVKIQRQPRFEKIIIEKDELTAIYKAGELILNELNKEKNYKKD